jgi:hypothetical protein
MKGLYVYALVPPGVDAALGTGLLGEPLEVVAAGAAVAAVAGAMDDRPSIAPASLRAHDDVVRRVAAVADAILPFRFGAMVTSARELEEGLAPRIDALASALERTRGCDQMTLRLYAPGSSPLPAQSGLAAVGPGTRFLRDRAAKTALPELERVRDALGSLVRGQVVEGHDAPPLRASVFHLVERARIPDYRASIDGLATTLAPARIVVTGPWPPYAFTELE